MGDKGVGEGDEIRREEADCWKERGEREFHGSGHAETFGREALVSRERKQRS